MVPCILFDRTVCERAGLLVHLVLFFFFLLLFALFRDAELEEAEG